LAESLMGEDK